MEQEIRSLIFIWLLIAGISVSNGQEVSTVGEVYNFEVGDIFHFDFWASAPQGGATSITNIEIINKTYSTGNDTLYYERSIAYHRTYPDPIIEYYVDTVFFTNLVSLIEMGNIDTVYTDPNLYNGRKINSLTYLTPEDVWTIDYVDGCGQARVYYSDWTSVFSEEELVYFKKGEEEWGTPISVGIAEAFTESLNITAYPNPFTSTTTIEYELKEVHSIQLTVYSSIGNVVYQIEKQNMAQGKHAITLSLHHLPAGLYYAVLRSEEGVSVVKLLKE